MLAWGGRAGRALAFLLTSKLEVLGQSTYLEILSPKSPPPPPATSQPSDSSPTASSCPQLLSSLDVPLTGSPMIVVKQAHSKPYQGASSLSLPAEPQLG